MLSRPKKSGFSGAAAARLAALHDTAMRPLLDDMQEQQLRAMYFEAYCDAAVSDGRVYAKHTQAVAHDDSPSSRGAKRQGGPFYALPSSLARVVAALNCTREVAWLVHDADGMAG